MNYRPAGYNNIDIEAAQARGVPVCTSPGYNAASVAEGAIMMMLMLVRRVHEQQVRSVLLFVGVAVAVFTLQCTLTLSSDSVYTCTIGLQLTSAQLHRLS